MNRNSILSTLLAGSLLVLSGCAEAPVKVGDNQVEKPLEQVTGITTADVEKASSLKEMGFWDVFTLAVERTELLASQHENIDQAEAQEQLAIASVLPQISISDTKNWQSNDYIFGSSNSLFTPLGNTIYLSGTETIFTGLNQVAALQGAGAAKSLTQYSFQQDARNLLLTLARSFYAVLQLENSLQSKQETEKLNEEILK